MGCMDMAVGATAPVSAEGGGAAVAQLPGGVPLVVRQRVRLGERLEVFLEDGLHSDGHAAIGSDGRQGVQLRCCTSGHFFGAKGEAALSGVGRWIPALRVSP